MEPQTNPMMSSPTPVTPPPVMEVPSQTPKAERKVGPIVTTLVIILILIIAGLFLFASNINRTDDGTDVVPAAAAMSAAESEADIADIADLEAELEGSTAGLEDENI